MSVVTRTRPRRTIAVALHGIEPATFERCAVIRDWLDEPLAAVDDVSATLALAVVTGLVLDLLTTGDRDRVQAAMERFFRLLRRHADEGAPSTR